MKIFLVNSRCAIGVAAGAFLCLVCAAPSSVNSQQTNVIPTIRMDNVPLNDAIRNLARQANLNYILDPKLDMPSIRSDGKSASESGTTWEKIKEFIVPSDPGKPATETAITVHLENMTAQQALTNVLGRHNLLMVENPATSVTRITYTNQATKSVDVTLLGSDTNGVIPLIVMSDMTLQDAINIFARQANLNYILDPKLSEHSLGTSLVSIRWEKMTARQALIALCENYDLVLLKDPATGAIRIKLRD